MIEWKPAIRNADFIRRTTAASTITAEFLQESDRGCILIGGAMLDELMRALLQAYFIGKKRSWSGCSTEDMHHSVHSPPASHYAVPLA